MTPYIPVIATAIAIVALAVLSAWGTYDDLR